MPEELKGEYKLLKVWECHRCKALVRFGKDVYEHKCNIKEDEWTEDKRTIEHQKKIIDGQNESIEERENIIKKQKDSLEDRDKYIVNLKNAIENHKGIIADREKDITVINEVIENQKKAIENQKGTIDDRCNTIDNQKGIIENQKKTIDDERKTIENQKNVIDSRDKVIDDQNKVIADLKNIIKEKEEKVDKEKVQQGLNDIENNIYIMSSEKSAKETQKIEKADKHYSGEQIYVDIWEQGKSIKDSKNLGYREDIEFEVFEKGKEKKRIIIRSGKVNKKPDDIDIIGKYTPEGFIIRGIQKRG